MSIISDVEKQVRARVEELKPLVDEYHQLVTVLETFAEAKAAKAPATKGKPRAKRRRGATAAAGSTTYSRGKRAEEALALVAANPGITIADIAEKMGIGPTYLYRVLPALEREGKVLKSGKGYQPA